MSNSQFLQPYYPYNLLLDAKGQTDLTFPGKLNADMQAGLRYVLSMLSPVEQELLRLYYAEGKACEEIGPMLGLSPEQAHGARAKAVKKLRLPSRWNYIQYGVAGYLKKEIANCYTKGYRIGYAEGRRHNPDITPQEDSLLSQPIEFLNLSPRAYNALHFAGYKFIGDLIPMEEIDILKINNLGRKSADEVARALLENGASYTIWYQFLL